MASHWYNTALKEVIDRTLDITTGCKVLLVTSSYVNDPDHTVADMGGANDVTDHELNVSGYTRGWTGAGRKAVTTTFTTDNTNNRAVISFTVDPLTWTALGAGQTIAGAILVKEGVTNDTNTKLIAYWDIADTPTNGGDFSLDFATSGAGGNLQINTVVA